MDLKTALITKTKSTLLITDESDIIEAIVFTLTEFLNRPTSYNYNALDYILSGECHETESLSCTHAQVCFRIGILKFVDFDESLSSLEKDQNFECLMNLLDLKLPFYNYLCKEGYM